MTNIIKRLPEGWWYQDSRNDHWYGPFDTAEEAERIARALAPSGSTFFNLINLRLREKRRVEIIDG